jgi:hypothetical protein
MTPPRAAACAIPRAPARPGRVGWLCAVVAAAALIVGPLRPLAAPASQAGDSRLGPEPPEVFAVVVGWNGGSSSLPPLRFADDDAARFASFFRGLATPAKPGRVWLLTELDQRTRSTLAAARLDVTPDGPPTRDAVLSTLRAAAAEIARASPRAPRALYVIYAGHGLQGRVLLKPTGGGEAALTGAELRTALADAAPAGGAGQIFVFLDACRSESLFSERGEDPGAADFGSAITELEQRGNSLAIGVLTAARNGRPAGEVSRLEAGYFSHVLGSGLAGGADADGDDVVSFAELAAFVSFNTQKLTGQMPWFDPPRGDLSARAIDHRGRRTRLLLPTDARGHFLIAAGQGRPVFAEAYQDRGQKLRLTLPPGSYQISRDSHSGSGGEITRVELGSGGVVDLGQASWQQSALGQRGDDPGSDSEAEDARLGFSAAFSSDVVSTLTAGFLAGRGRPVQTGRSFAALELGAAPAPLGLAGFESQLHLRLGRSVVAGLVVSGVLGAAHSRHDQTAEPYTLDRFFAGIDAHWPWRIATRASLGPAVAAGLGMLLRRADGPTTGDLYSPWFEAGVRGEYALAAPYFLSLSFSYAGSFVKVDGSKESTSGPRAGFGAGASF